MKVALRSRPVGGGFNSHKLLRFNDRGGGTLWLKGETVITSCVDERDESNEPPMTHRKSINGIETRSPSALGRAYGYLLTAIGVRCEGGVTLMRALVRNLELRCDLRKRHNGGTVGQSTDDNQGGLLRITKSGVMPVSKGAGHRRRVIVNRKREEPDWARRRPPRWHEPDNKVHPESRLGWIPRGDSAARACVGCNP